VVVKGRPWLCLVTLLLGAASGPVDYVAHGRGDVAVAQSMPSGTSWLGSPSVGALFSDDGTHYCTASVIDSPEKDLILTAAHCLYDPGSHTWRSDLEFVPGYWEGHEPYGTWTVQHMVVDPSWLSSGNPSVDYGFAIVTPQTGSRQIQLAVGGADQLAAGRRPRGGVFVTGYPMRRYVAQDEPIFCQAPVWRQSPGQLGFTCDGFPAGTSGSPWIADYNAATRSGQVVGVIGGYQEGGLTGSMSYSPVLGGGIQRLYRQITG
jgi:V8-like Glu-specific endopeptidase